MERRELTCIGCPMGCLVTVELEGAEVAAVLGHTCPRGEVYARREVTNPTRIVTSTVRVLAGERERVSCKTAQDIPKDRISDVMAAINAVSVSAPVHIGDVLIEDAARTGVAVVATSSVTRKG